MNRIDPGEVTKFFRHNPHIKPARRLYRLPASGPIKSCCGLTAVALGRGVDPDSFMCGTTLCQVNRLTDDYGYGFMDGWDGYAANAGVWASKDVYEVGYQDGRAAWLATGGAK